MNTSFQLEHEKREGGELTGPERSAFLQIWLKNE